MNKTRKAPRPLCLLNRMRSLLCLCFIAFVIPCLTGCQAVEKKTASLQAYQEAMGSFFEQIENYTRQLGDLSPDLSSESETDDDTDNSGNNSSGTNLSETESQFLALIDQLADACAAAADVEVPRNYEEAGHLCIAADEAMQDAREGYHKAFEAESFDESAFEEAQLQYQTAMEEIQELSLYFQNFGTKE